MAVSTENELRVWLLPHLYWKQTKGMRPQEIDELMSEVERLAEARDFDSLRKYSFIYVGVTCHRRVEPLAQGQLK